jgi:ParB family transcriptional regulator, chromosome partitioning protein
MTGKPKGKSIFDAMGLDDGAPVAAPVATETTRKVVVAPAATAKATELAISTIQPDPKQPRRAFDPEKLDALAASIRDVGVLKAILVRKHPEGDGWLIVDGERRWRAAKLAGVETVPVAYRDDLSSEDSRRLYIQTIANAHSEGLTDLEMARVIDQLTREGFKKGEFAVELGIKATRISLYLAMLEPDVLPHCEANIIQTAYVAKAFSVLDGEGKARALRMASEAGGKMTQAMAEQARNAPTTGEGEGGEPSTTPVKPIEPKAPKPPKAPTTVKLQLSVDGLRRLADALGDGEAVDVVLPVVRGEALIGELASHFDPAEEDLASRLRDLLNVG